MCWSSNGNDANVRLRVRGRRCDMAAGSVVSGGKQWRSLWSCPRRWLLPGQRQARGSCLGVSYVIDHESPTRRIPKRPPLSDFYSISCVMATPARLVSSLRRSALSARVAPRSHCLRLAPQARRITSATSEPHQPDSKGGLDGPAPAKTIKFTSESYVATV